jgi:hypothetical protein
MAVLPTGIGPVTGYQIERSLRFNSADSAYLNRTLTTPTNNKIWTWSGWVKRSAFGTAQALIGTTDDNTVAGNVGAIRFTTSNTLEYFEYSSAYSLQLITTQVFRDPSAWYHIVFAIDTTQATPSNRVKLYVNGVQVTVFGTATYPALNLSLYINSARATYQGSYWNSSSGITAPFNGYLTEINFIDGQVPTTTTRTVNGITETILTQLGEFNSSTGVWTPKAWGGTYGTNGFFLKFADNSNTTAATLGKDYSGNGNNWTPNSFYVGPGSSQSQKAGIDSLIDSPTNYGSDTGLGGEVRGNYCTMNPLTAQQNVLSEGNLKTLNSTSTNGTVGSTWGMTSGKWYWEAFVFTGGGATSFPMFGIAKDTYIGFRTTGYYTGTTADSWGLFCNTGGFVNNNGVIATYSTIANGDIVMLAYDADNGKFYMGKNGTWFNSANPASGTNAIVSSGLTGSTIFATVSDFSGSGAYMNFGQRAFAYTAPSGFKALCTQNLPTPAIGATSTTQANKYMDVTLYTGNGAVRSITNSGSMQPDFVWDKLRSGINSHRLFDAVRGVEKSLYSNLTNAETTETGTLTSFNSNGFSLGTNTETNTNTSTYVAWQWNAGGSNATNTSGTITSTVRANTTSGFSIIQWSGSGANATIGHGLGTTPAFIIVKDKSSGTNGGAVYHTSRGATKYLKLFQTTTGTDPEATDNTAWNGSSPTFNSTVFSVGSLARTNASGTSNMIAYAFAEVPGYSAFGSYTGNGATVGPFVYTGFRPRFVLTKGASTSNWAIIDTSTSPYNVAPNLSIPNSSGAELAFSSLDILSNGFQIRNNDSAFNSNGGTYIYAAFAESPFKYSLAR